MRKDKVFPRLIVFALVLFVLKASAQGDSTRAPNDKKLNKLLGKVGEDSVKLVRYQGMVSQFEKDKKNADELAQQSANDNKQAADRLADNPEDKRLARRARSAARTAKGDSQKARVAADKLVDLNDDIKKLTRQLDKEQTKLTTYKAAQAPAISAH